jgi:hypothetical protein
VDTVEEEDWVRDWEASHADVRTGDSEVVETFRASRSAAVARGNELTEQTGRKVYVEPVDRSTRR